MKFDGIVHDPWIDDGEIVNGRAIGPRFMATLWQRPDGEREEGHEINWGLVLPHQYARVLPGALFVMTIDLESGTGPHQWVEFFEPDTAFEITWWETCCRAGNRWPSDQICR